MEPGKWEVVIGLEIHVQLNTNTKAFCSDKNQFLSEPNENISAISLAHPGTLPRMNKQHALAGAKLGLAFDGSVNTISYFDRKNYFYPDLPKGYQITQDERPISEGGYFNYIMGDGEMKRVSIHHLHLEEDAGKSVHDISPSSTLLNYNRAGVPLLEVVTNPDFRSADEVFYFIQELQKLVRHLEISNGNMEEGSFRCDCNVSIRPHGQEEYGTRCEIKNINSKRYARQAITYEAQRQIREIEAGREIHQETRLFDPSTGLTQGMRSKENVNDYRYFSDPDLPPIVIQDNEILKLKESINELPTAVYARLRSINIAHDDALLIAEHKDLIAFCDNLIASTQQEKEVSLLISNKLWPAIVEEKISLPIQEYVYERAAEFIRIISSGKVSKASAYQKLWHKVLINDDSSILKHAESMGLIIETDQSFLDEIIEQVIKENQDKVKAYQKGKKGLIGFFMGQIMKQSQNKADPKTLNKKIIDALNTEQK